MLNSVQKPGDPKPVEALPQVPEMIHVPGPTNVIALVPVTLPWRFKPVAAGRLTVLLVPETVMAPANWFVKPLASTASVALVIRTTLLRTLLINSLVRWNCSVAPG